MKHRSKLLLPAALIAAFLSLASCQESSIEPEINTDPAPEITENAEASETPDALGEDSPDPIDYSDHDVIRALYEEQGYTVNKIYQLGYANGCDNLIVEYYSADGEITDYNYLYRFDWFDALTGNSVNAQYIYESNNSFVYAVPRSDTFQLLESDGSLGTIITMTFDGKTASYTEQDYYKSFKNDSLFWTLNDGIGFCAYLDDIEYNFDDVENSIRFGFKGNMYFCVFRRIPPMLIMFDHDSLMEYLESNLYFNHSIPFKDELSTEPNTMFIVMHNTILGEDFDIPVQDESSGIQITNVVCSGKDTIIEISITDNSLTYYTAKIVWTEWTNYESEGKIGLHLLFADDTVREGVYIDSPF